MSEQVERRKPTVDPVAVMASIKRSLNVLIAATVVLYLAGIGFVALYVVPQVHKANDALCTFRADLQQRVQQGQDFLEQHPEGFGDFGPAQIRANIANQSRTVAALAVLDCPEVPEPLPPTSLDSVPRPR